MMIRFYRNFGIIKIFQEIFYNFKYKLGKYRKMLN